MRERGPRVLGEKKEKERKYSKKTRIRHGFLTCSLLGRPRIMLSRFYSQCTGSPPPSRGLDTAGRVSRKTICMASSSSGTFSLPFTVLTSRLDFSYDYKKHAGSFQWRTKFYPVLLLIAVQSFWRFAVEWEVCSSAQSRRESG